MLSAVRRSFETHLVTLRAVSAFARLGIVIGLIVFGLSHNASPLPRPAADQITDVKLYERIVVDMRGGQSYYAATAHEHRTHGYPLRPFVTVRLPTLAWMLTLLPGEIAQRAMLLLLALATVAAWAWRLAAAGTPPGRYAAALIALVIGVSFALAPTGPLLHEIWAALLIALSMALRRPNAWLAAVAAGTAAALLRELAAPYLLVMALMAAWERNYREAGAWCAGLAVFAGALTLHALQVNALAAPTDLGSPGWLALGGWRFVLQTAYWLPDMFGIGWSVAILLPLALLGLTARPLDWRLSLTVGGYMAGFLFIGRHDTSYWGLMITPLWPLGLAWTWPAIVECLGDIRGPGLGRGHTEMVVEPAE